MAHDAPATTGPEAPISMSTACRGASGGMLTAATAATAAASVGGDSQGGATEVCSCVQAGQRGRRRVPQESELAVVPTRQTATPPRLAGGDAGRFAVHLTLGCCPAPQKEQASCFSSRSSPRSSLPNPGLSLRGHAALVCAPHTPSLCSRPVQATGARSVAALGNWAHQSPPLRAVVSWISSK